MTTLNDKCLDLVRTMLELGDSLDPVQASYWVERAYDAGDISDDQRDALLIVASGAAETAWLEAEMEAMSRVKP